MRKFFHLVLILHVLSIPLFAQNNKALVDKGDKAFSRKDYEGALATYLEAIKSSPDDAGVNFRVGLCYLHTEKKGKSLQFLEKAYALKPDVDQDIDYHLGLDYQTNHYFVKAIINL